jgi:DNA-binding NtrC family response regulator
METNKTNTRVLVFAPIGRDGAASAEMLGRAGRNVVLCKDLTELVAEIQAGVGAVFVAEEGLFGKDTGPLIDWVKQQAAWSDLPFIVLTSHHEEPRVVAWRQQLNAALRNMRFARYLMNAIARPRSWKRSSRIGRGRFMKPMPS